SPAIPPAPSPSTGGSPAEAGSPAGRMITVRGGRATGILVAPGARLGAEPGARVYFPGAPPHPCPRSARRRGVDARPPLGGGAPPRARSRRGRAAGDARRLAG